MPYKCNSVPELSNSAYGERAKQVLQDDPKLANGASLEEILSEISRFREAIARLTPEQIQIIFQDSAPMELIINADAVISEKELEEVLNLSSEQYSTHKLLEILNKVFGFEGITPEGIERIENRSNSITKEDIDEYYKLSHNANIVDFVSPKGNAWFAIALISYLATRSREMPTVKLQALDEEYGSIEVYRQFRTEYETYIKLKNFAKALEKLFTIKMLNAPGILSREIIEAFWELTTQKGSEDLDIDSLPRTAQLQLLKLNRIIEILKENNYIFCDDDLLVPAIYMYQDKKHYRMASETRWAKAKVL